MTEVENIKVSIRVRPLNRREEENKEKEAWRVVDGISIVPTEHNPRQGTGTSYTYDHVFDYRTTTQDVYDKCAKEIILSGLKGQNGTIFVYGQTSSGKTHTMQGTALDPGIVPLSISYIFDHIKKSPKQDFLVRCSYIEIYNECITDLLDTKKTNLKIRETPKAGVAVLGVTAPFIANANQALEVIQRGASQRHVGETKMNEASSRSHSIFRMVIESKDKDTEEEGAVRIGELNLVDLAGSERQSQTQATGARLKEGANINKSLLILGNVISKLSDGNEKQHIPYRESKLTRILEPALGGNSRTCIVGTITPAAVHAEETSSTLKFALRARSIANTATVNETLGKDAMLKVYKKEIDDLKRRLRYTSAGGEKDLEICSMMNQLEELRENNQALQEEKSALEAEQQHAEQRIARLANLVVLSGAAMSEDAPQPRKARPTVRQSWCPTGRGVPIGGALGGGAGRLGNVSVIEEQEGEEGEEGEESVLGGRSLRESDAADGGGPVAARLEEENARLAGELGEERARGERLQAEIDRLTAGHGAPTAAAAPGGDGAEELRSRLGESEEEASKLRSELEALQAARKAEQEEGEISIEAAANRIIELTHELETLRAENERSKPAGSGDESDALQSRLNESEEEASKLRSELEALQAARQEGEMSIEAAANRIVELTHELETVRAENERSKSAGDDAAALRSRLGESEEEASKLRSELEALQAARKAEQEEGESSIEAAANRIIELTHELDAVRAESEQYKALLQEMEAALRQQAASAETERAEREKLASRAEASAKELAASHALLEAEARKSGEAAARVAELNGALKEARGVIEGLRTTEAMLEQSERDYLEQKEALEGALRECERWRGASERAEAELQAAQEAAQEQEFEAARARARLEEDVEVLKASEARLIGEQEELMARLVDCEEQLDTTKNALQDLRLTEQELRGEVAELQEEARHPARPPSSAANKRVSTFGPIKSESSFGSMTRRESVYTGAGAAGHGDSASLRRELGSKEQRCADLEKARDKAEKSLEHLKTEFAQAKEELAQAKKEARLKAQKASSLEKGQEDFEKDREKLKSKVAALEEKLKGLQQEKSALSLEKSTAEREARKLTERAESLEKEAEKLRLANQKMKETSAALACAERRADAAQSEADATRRESDERAAEIGRLSAALAESQAELQLLTAAHGELSAINAQAVAENRDLHHQQADLERLCEDFNAQIKQSSTKAAALSATIADLGEQKQALEAASASLQQQLRAAEEENRRSAKVVQGLQKDLDDAEAQVDSVSKRLEAQKGELLRLRGCEELSQDLKEQVRALREDQLRTFNSLTDANFELQQLRTEYQALEGEGADATARLEAQLLDTQDQLRRAEEEKSALRLQFAQFTDTTRLMDSTEVLGKRISQLEAEVSRGEEELAQARERHRDLMEEKRASDDEARRQAARGAELAREAEEVRGSLDVKERECARLKSDLEEMFVEHRRGESELAAAREAAQRHNLDLAELRGQLAGAEREAAALQGQLRAQAQASVDLSARFDSELSASRERAYGLQAECEQLRQALERGAERAAALETENAALAAAVQERAASGEQLAATVSRMTAERGALEAARLELEADLARSEQALEQARERLQEGARALAEAQALSGAREREAAQAQARVEELLAAQAGLAQRCERLDSEKGVLQHLLEVKDTTGARVAETVGKLSDELEAVRALHRQLEAEHGALARAHERALAEARALGERQGEADELSAQACVLREDNAQLRRDLDAAARRADALEAELAAASDAARQSADSSSGLAGAMAALQAEAAGLRAAAADGERRLDEARAAAAALAERCERAEAERASLQRLFESKDAAGARVAETVGKLSDELEAVRALHRQLEAEHGALARAHERALAEARALEERSAAAEAARDDRGARLAQAEAAIEAAAAAQREEAARHRARLQAAQQEAARREAENRELAHKAVMMKAEYHGRIDRRDKRIEALTARLADGGGGKGGGAALVEDKENARPRVNMA